MTNQQILAMRKLEAEKAHEQYPQYKNHWDGWVLGTVRKRVKTKFGVAFEPGDKVLVKPEIRDLTGETFSKRKDKRSVTAYSFRNEINTSIWYDEIDVTF